VKQGGYSITDKQIPLQTVATENNAAAATATTCCTLGVADSGGYPNTPRMLIFFLLSAFF